METHKRISKVKALVGLVVLLSGIFLVSLWMRRWPVLASAIVTQNGQMSPGWRLYGLSQGEFILQPPEREGFTCYWLVPSEKKVYYTGSSNFVSVPFGLHVIHPRQYGIDLEYTAKSGIKPNVVAGHNFIEFTSLRRQRLRVVW